MLTATSFPGPRDGLDEGSLTELAQDGREIEVKADLKRPQQWVPSTCSPIDVPDDAPSLIDQLPAYGG